MVTFCNVCGNMCEMDLTTNDGTTCCRNCGTKMPFDPKELCVSKVSMRGTTNHFENIINEYTIFDPALPHRFDLLCPNVDCPTNKDKKPADIVYINYDKVNMKYIYICTNCNTKWSS